MAQSAERSAIVNECHRSSTAAGCVSLRTTNEEMVPNRAKPETMRPCFLNRL